jgi:CheY-like chemotaxis protein
MGSELKVESTYGEGSSFSFDLWQKIVNEEPIGDYKVALPDKEMEIYRESFRAPDARILIVDDTKMNIIVAENLLTTTGIGIDTALNGREAIKLCEDNKYDVILLDQMMPGMSGKETLNVIRGERLADNTPVIALTADAIVGARDNYLRDGFTDYLSKPVMYEDLERILLKYIDASLLMTEEMLKYEEENKPRPIVLVVNDSPERLNEIKEMLGTGFKGVYVRDEEQAQKYLEGHEVEFVIRDGGPR